MHLFVCPNRGARCDGDYGVCKKCEALMCSCADCGCSFCKESDEDAAEE